MQSIVNLCYNVNSEQEFDIEWERMLSRWEQYPDFLNYMTRQWKPSRQRWSSAWRKFPHDAINTNNFVESWHNQLKRNYLGLMRRQRLDFLVFVLARRVYPDFKQAHFQVLAGYATRRRSKAEQEAYRKAMEWPLEDANDMVDLEDSSFQAPTIEVQSFTSDEKWYQLAINNIDDSFCIDGCTCPVGESDDLCKHMFLAQRVTKYNIQQNRFLLNTSQAPAAGVTVPLPLLEGEIHLLEQLNLKLIYIIQQRHTFTSGQC